MGDTYAKRFRERAKLLKNCMADEEYRAKGEKREVNRNNAYVTFFDTYISAVEDTLREYITSRRLRAGAKETGEPPGFFTMANWHNPRKTDANINLAEAIELSLLYFESPKVGVAEYKKDPSKDNLLDVFKNIEAFSFDIKSNDTHRSGACYIDLDRTSDLRALIDAISNFSRSENDEFTSKEIRGWNDRDYDLKQGYFPEKQDDEKQETEYTMGVF